MQTEVMSDLTYTEQLEVFALLLRDQTKERLEKNSMNKDGCNEPTTRVVLGKKYAKVDIGPNGQYSGRYMVDKSGNIYGVKAYGVIH